MQWCGRKVKRLRRWMCFDYCGRERVSDICPSVQHFTLLLVMAWLLVSVISHLLPRTGHRASGTLALLSGLRWVAWYISRRLPLRQARTTRPALVSMVTRRSDHSRHSLLRIRIFLASPRAGLDRSQYPHRSWFVLYRPKFCAHTKDGRHSHACAGGQHPAFYYQFNRSWALSSNYWHLERCD
jgi:hypothetical protein